MLSTFIIKRKTEKKKNPSNNNKNTANYYCNKLGIKTNDKFKIDKKPRVDLEPHKIITTFDVMKDLRG